MASLCFTHSLPLLRHKSNWPTIVAPNFVPLKDLKPKWGTLKTISKRYVTKSRQGDASEENARESSINEKPVRRRGRKKSKSEDSEETIESRVHKNLEDIETEAKPIQRKGRRKVKVETSEEANSFPVLSSVEEVENNSKPARRRGRKKLSTESPEEGIKLPLLGNVAEEESNARLPSRRGRKKKNLVDMEETGASDTASDVEEEGNSKLPPRRGRKKSNIADIEEIDASASASDVEEESNSRLPSRRGRKKSNLVDVEPIDASSSGSDVEENAIAMSSMLDEDSKKAPRRSRRKSTVVPSSGGEVVEKKTTRRTKKKVENIENGIFGSEIGTSEESNLPIMVEDKNEGLVFDEIEDGDDISFSYGWPPLVCCFGAAQHAFMPSGRRANRLIDHEMHETMKDAFWSPTTFFRAPGSSSSSVAVALASLGGKVAFMGKLGDDDYGQAMLYYLNVNKVQTRSVKVDGSKLTGVSYMKITRKGGLKITCNRPCAEDSLLRSEINIDVLKEARMFYFNSSSLLDPDMRSTTLQAIHISKKFGGVIFFDLNLPLPLWHSNVETKAFIQEAWNCADIIEVTKQELEFLCGITPLEEFDTKDNDRSKFTHYKREVITPLWHENLKVLFVTNGTSKIHFYTDQENGAVLGMEDPPITPFTCDMSVSGDAIVAALMRMLTVQPHLVTDQGYLKHSIKYAIDCGVIDQWLLARIRGFPPEEEMEGSSIKPNGVISVSEKEHRTLETVS